LIAREVMKLIHPAKLKEYEVQANTASFTYDEMMHIAGKALADVVINRFELLDSKKISGLIGGGKNGTDTLIALTHLRSEGWQTWAIKITPSNLPNWAINDYKKAGGELIDIQDQARCSQVIKESMIILDGIIGTGFVPPMREDLAAKMKVLRKWCTGKDIVAVDCPSGVDCESGLVDEHTLKAEICVCMEAVKPGLLKFPAFNYAGEICQVDIGILKKLHMDGHKEDNVLDDRLITSILPGRKNDSHKGSFGSVLICGGSVNFPGAPVFAAKAAYKSGVGLVKSAVPERIYEICANQHPESTWVILNDENGVISESAAKLIQNEIPKVNCLAIGPGLGTEETTFRFFKEILLPGNGIEKKHGIGFLPEQAMNKPEMGPVTPMVIDADGLKLLSRIPNWEKLTSQKLVLTPHPGEMSEITGLSIDEIQSNRMEICKEYAKKWNQVVVLKGALTVIGSPEGRIAVCPIASSALAKAGSGDILTGLIAGLIAQGVGLFDAAVVGAWVHASAGVLAARLGSRERCVGISEILSSLPEIFSRIETK